MGGVNTGKVYFVMYLAVLLELLIIIVERDDAEEALQKEKEALLQKEKRIQLIAETIINSLRGSPTAISATSDQSMVLAIRTRRTVASSIFASGWPIRCAIP